MSDKKKPPIGWSYVLPFHIGDFVHIDGDTDIRAIVVAMRVYGSPEHTPNCDVDVTWFAHGEHKTALIDSWRCQLAND